MLFYRKEAIPRLRKGFSDAAKASTYSAAGSLWLSLLDSEMKEWRWVGGGCGGGVMKVNH